MIFEGRLTSIQYAELEYPHNSGNKERAGMNGYGECVPNIRRGHSSSTPHLPANGGCPYKQNGQWEDIIKETAAKDSAREWFVCLGRWRYCRKPADQED
jgi:hypothetical protein